MGDTMAKKKNNQKTKEKKIEEVDVTPKEENVVEDVSLQNLIEKDTNSLFVVVLVGVIAALCTFVLLSYVDGQKTREETIIGNFTIKEKVQTDTSTNSSAVEIEYSTTGGTVEIVK